MNSAQPQWCRGGRRGDRMPLDAFAREDTRHYTAHLDLARGVARPKRFNESAATADYIQELEPVQTT